MEREVAVQRVTLEQVRTAAGVTIALGYQGLGQSRLQPAGPRGRQTWESQGPGPVFGGSSHFSEKGPRQELMVRRSCVHPGSVREKWKVTGSAFGPGDQVRTLAFTLSSVGGHCFCLGKLSRYHSTLQM